MRIGSKLKKKFAGLSREQMAEKLIEEHLQKGRRNIGEANQQQFVVHSLVLQPDRTAHFELPFDLTRQEAERITKFIQLLVLPSTPEGN